MNTSCPTCRRPFADDDVPPEPPVGTWIKDRHGGTSQRQRDGWGAPGIVPFGKWEAMWRSRGPLIECGPWGAPLTGDQAECAGGAGSES